MQFQSEKNEGVIVVAAEGSIDALTAPETTDFLLAQVAGGHSDLVFDMSGVPYMSSAGLRTLVAVLKEARTQNGDLRLAAAQADVQKVLEMSGFLKILDHYPSVEEAVASYR